MPDILPSKHKLRNRYRSTVSSNNQINNWLTNNVNLQQINHYTLHGYPINFVQGYCIAAEPDPVRIIGVQIAELQLKQPN